MNKTWIFGILLLLILAACAPQAPKTEEKTEEETVPTEAPKPIETAEPEVGVKPPTRPLPSERQDTPPAPAPTTTTEAKQEMSPALRDLLKRADEKLSSLQYLYGGTATGNLFLDTYMVKGTKLKIRKYSDDYYVREGYYDTVYYDLGVACCETQNRCKSHNIDNTGKKFDVDVSSHDVPKTPYQWIKEVPANTIIVGPQTFNERSVTNIKYTDSNGQETLMWVDDTYGVPHKVVVTDKNGNAITYQYNDMLFNGLKDADFNPPCD